MSHRNSFRLATLVFMVFLIVIFVGNPDLGAQKLPLTVDDLTSLVGGGVPEERLLYLAKECGISFPPTPETLDKLKAAGVPDAVLNEIRTQSPVGPDFYLRDGDRLLAQGQYDLAIGRYKKILDLLPDDPGAKGRIAKAEEAKKQAQAEAQRHAEEAQQHEQEAKERTNLPYYQEQLRAARQSGDCGGAIPYAKKILAVVPGDSESQKALEDCALGQDRQQLRAALGKSDWPAARASANKILAVTPTDVEAQKAVKDCDLAASRQQVTEALRKGDCDAALPGAQKFFAIVPNDAEITRAIDWCSKERFVLKQTLASGSGRRIALSRDGRLLAGVSNQTCDNNTSSTLTVWDVATRAATAAMTASGVVNSLSFSPDGRLLAVATGNTWCGGPRGVQIWEVATAKLKRTLTGHTDIVNAVAFSPDGRLLATGDPEIRIYEMPAGTLKQTLAEKAYSFCLTFSPDGRSLAQGGNNGNVFIWDLPTGALRQTFAGISLWSIAFSPDGRLMFGGAEKSVKILDGQTGALKQSLSVAGDKVQSVGLSPDGRWLVSADKDIKFWERAQ